MQQHEQEQEPKTTGRMVARRVSLGALILVAALVGSGMYGMGGIASTAHTAPMTRQTSPQSVRQSPSRATFSVPHEVSKTILGETSIDGPAFWTNNGPSQSPPLFFLAWTGTDAAHHVNYLAPAIASTKVTLRETSIAHPAALSGGNINDLIAWTGTDSLHHLNIMCVRGCGAATNVKLTLHETSNAGPALVRGGSLGQLLAWTGTDANHSLNVLPLGITGAQNQEHWVTGAKVILPQFSSIAGPGLASGLSNNLLGLSFAQPSGRIGFATSSDGGVHWTMPSTSPLRETSTATPNLFGASATPHDWLTWTGTDAAHHVNVQFTTDFPSWPSAGTKATLNETALGGPVMGLEVTSTASQFVVAWTGTDAAHHLNIAVIEV